MTAPFQLVPYLKAMRQRAGLLQPATASAVGAVLDKMIRNQEGDPQATPEVRAAEVAANLESYGKLITASRSGDAAATAELTKIRTIKLQNLLFARSNVLQFFDTVVLAPNEVPEFQNETKAKLQVSFIGQDGRAKRAQATRLRERVQIQLHLLSTPEYEYPLKDMYKGSVAEEAKALVDLSFDLDRQIEALAWPYLAGQIGAFTLTGASSLRTWFIHSNVDSDNIPTTNLLVPAGNTNTSLFRKECLDVILQYVAAWGEAWPDGMLAPVAIYVPSSEAMGFLGQVTLTTQENALNTQIFNTGSIFSYAGYKWNIIPDATLSPKKGLAYVRMNKPAGTLFTKPFMDDLIVDNSMALRKQNKESMSMVKAIGWGVPNTAKINVAAVRYHNDVS